MQRVTHIWTEELTEAPGSCSRVVLQELCFIALYLGMLFSQLTQKTVNNCSFCHSITYILASRIWREVHISHGFVPL